MQEEPPTAGKPAGYTAFFTDAHWWFFCLLILVLNFPLLAFDPLPKLFMGDSGSYLWTALSGWMPPDRSFLYGYVIRWSSLWTGSLTSLLILQAFLGAITAILVGLVCRWIFGLAFGLFYLFGVLCLLDPLQFGTVTLFTMVPTVRYLQPLSLLTILIFAAFVKAVIDRRSIRHRRGAMNIIHHLATDPTSPSQ